MIGFLKRLHQAALLLVLAGSVISTAQGIETTAAEDSGWTHIVRSSPYWDSQGVFENILTIRRWVLKESGYCAVADRHILFDMRGRFLAWIGDGDNREATQRLLNKTRQSLYESSKVEAWVAGQTESGVPGMTSTLPTVVRQKACTPHFYMSTNTAATRTV